MSRTTVLKIVLPFMVLGVGVAIVMVLFASRQAPVKEVQEFAGALVETVTVQQGDHIVRVAATGTVQARQKAEIVAQVSGQVTLLADEFIAGGMFKKGETLFRLEDVDYRLAVDGAEADLAAAELELAMVKGQARVARDEWQRLQVGQGEPNPLVLYEPQLKNAEGRVTAAKAALKQALINLERTEVRAPFNCLVLSEGIDLGQYVRAGATVGTLLGTDTAEIVVPLPLDALPWLNIPRGGGQGAAAIVRFTAGALSYDWPGRLVRTLGEVDPLGRMARVVVAVDDPYLLQRPATDERPPLAVGSFVDLELQGKRLASVSVLPRRALRDNNTVWVADSDSLLRIRPVQVLRRDQDSVIIGNGLQDGERVIVTALAGAADGLKVRVRGEAVGVMNGALRWMTQNHVAANLLMLAFVVGGLIIGLSVKQEVFPEVALDKIQVAVSYPGAGPEEVEDGILLKIEENLTGVDGIRQLKALAVEGYGTVTAELMTGADPNVVLQDVKTEVDRIITFPEEAEKPVITKLLNRSEVVSVVVYGDLAERSLREQAENMREELLTLPGITQVDLSGVRPYEISIEISEANLRRYRLTLEQVARRIRQASLDMPGGTIKTAGGEILVRTKERRYLGREYEGIVVVNDADGTEVRLGEIAEVKDTFRETDEFARFDGQPAAMVKIFRVGDQKPTEISATVKEYVAQKRQRLPASVKLAVWNDTSEIFASRMSLLTKNAVLGLSLVLLVLGLFLEVRLALWVMLGIPISFLGALFCLPVFDASINMISLFAFIMALGILVDDAIVVGENVFEHRQQGKPYLRAAIDGAIEVAPPVVFAILTSVAAFCPLLFISGTMGKFIKTIPVVVIILFLISLIESLFVLPAHLAIGGPRPVGKDGLLAAIERVRLGFGNKLRAFIEGPYHRFLKLVLTWRYVTVAAAISILLLCAGLVGGGILKFRFMPKVDGELILVDLVMLPGTPVAETRRVQQFIEEQGRATITEFNKQDAENETILRNMYSLIGSSIKGGGPEGVTTTSGANLSTIAVFLIPSEQRIISASQVASRWRTLVGEIPGVDSLTFTTDLVQMGANIDIQLAHENFSVLAQAADRLKNAIGDYPGVGDIASSYSRGKKELKFRLSSEARTLGVTEEDLGRQLRAAFYGAEAVRLQRGRNEVRVMVRYPEQDRRHLWNLETLRVRLANGGELPLARAAEVEPGRGFDSINRTDRKRVINVTASVDDRQANAEEILAELKNTLLVDLAADYPGLSFNMEGEAKEFKDVMDSMKRGYLLAMFAIFALLAIPFRSYSQPLLIMVAIPFGIVGAALGHLLMGYSLSIMSVFGIVALSGVVVNDSLLLIDYVNTRRRAGDDLREAILQAGRRRFRPILLTSLTTFFGLAPMILETSMQAKFLIPMAISLGFGILFATGITLLLIPALYLVLEDVRGLFGLKPGHANHGRDATL